MGRVKLKIQRLESISSRQVTYGKRRAGILKKAQEISVLCDIDIILLMFSPAGKPSIFHGQRSNIDEMIAKYAQLSPTERAKRRLESLETLKRNFKKLDQDVDIEEFLDLSSPPVEEMQNQITMLQAQLTNIRKRLSFWTNPDKIEDIEHLQQMENKLRESLNRVRLQKDSFQRQNFGNSQLMSPNCTSQFQDAVHFPLMSIGDQDDQMQSWSRNAEYQHMMLPNEPTFLPHGDMGCSRDTSLPNYSDFFDAGKEMNLENPREVTHEREDGITIQDYSSSAHLGSELDEHYPFHSYDHLQFPEIVEPRPEANFQECALNYQINSNFTTPTIVYNNFQQSLLPTAASYAISVHKENSYPQRSNHMDN